MARDGIADLTYVNPGYQPGRFPIIDAGKLPFLMTNAKGGSQALDDWYRKYADKEMKDVKFCLAFVHDPGTFHSRDKKIMVPADIKGMKIRPRTRPWPRWVTQLGGTNVQASAPEVRDILEKGVADAVTFPWGSMCCSASTRSPSTTWRPRSTDQLRLGDEQIDLRADVAGAEESDRRPLQQGMGASKIAAPWAAFEHDGIAKLKAEPGQEVYDLEGGATRRVAEIGRAAGEEVGGRRRGSAGVDPDAAMKELKADLVKYKAGY